MPFSVKTTYITLIVSNIVCGLMYLILACLAETPLSMVLRLICTLCWGGCALVYTLGYRKTKRLYEEDKPNDDSQ